MVNVFSTKCQLTVLVPIVLAWNACQAHPEPFALDTGTISRLYHEKEQAVSLQNRAD